MFIDLWCSFNDCKIGFVFHIVMLGEFYHYHVALVYTPKLAATCFQHESPNVHWIICPTPRSPQPSSPPSTQTKGTLAIDTTWQNQTCSAKTSWRRNVMAEFSQVKLTWGEAHHAAQNRDIWRRIVVAWCPSFKSFNITWIAAGVSGSYITFSSWPNTPIVTWKEWKWNKSNQ